VAEKTKVVFPLPLPDLASMHINHKKKKRIKGKKETQEKKRAKRISLGNHHSSNT
jgi:hypothetical protein